MDIKYKILKFIVLSFIIIYYLYLKMHMPITLIIILEILLLIKLLPISEYLEKRILKYYPKYKNLNIWIKRLILFIFYVLIYMILKFIIVKIILIGMLGLPVEEQIYDFINKSLN